MLTVVNSFISHRSSGKISCWH